MDGPYSYAGPIPCHTCKWYSDKEDNFEPAGRSEAISTIALQDGLDCINVGTSGESPEPAAPYRAFDETKNL